MPVDDESIIESINLLRDGQTEIRDLLLFLVANTFQESATLFPENREDVRLTRERVERGEVPPSVQDAMSRVRAHQQDRLN